MVLVVFFFSARRVKLKLWKQWSIQTRVKANEAENSSVHTIRLAIMKRFSASKNDRSFLKNISLGMERDFIGMMIYAVLFNFKIKPVELHENRVHRSKIQHRYDTRIPYRNAGHRRLRLLIF